jgi:hypothetical protein
MLMDIYYRRLQPQRLCQQHTNITTQEHMYIIIITQENILIELIQLENRLLRTVFPSDMTPQQ